MDDLICEIRSLLELGYEGGYWDFKSDYPDKNKKEDKLHDIICMANNLEDTATRTNGAVAVFLPGVAQRLSDLLDGGFYMVFTSIHEVMIHSEKTADPKDLKRVLADTVRDTTPDEDFLTYYVYHYNRETGQFTYC